MKNRNIRPIYFDEYKKINGIYQYLLHSGTSYNNPVMLFLHASGFPESLVAYKFQKEWENIFTIVNLDQRGTGKTFTKNPNERPTVDKLIEDIHQTIKYLKQKYNKDKIVIFGHSLGTMLGTIYIKKYPEDVLYYIGTGQVIDFKYGEHAAYQTLKDKVIKNNDKKSLDMLIKLGDDFPADRNGNEYAKDATGFKKLEQKYKMVENCVTFSMLKNLFMSPIFKWSDVSALIKSTKVNDIVVDQTVKVNFRDESYDYEVPIYYIDGENDWQTPYFAAKEYFDKIEAPRKKFYTIPDSGHIAVLLKPDLFYKALCDIKRRES